MMTPTLSRGWQLSLILLIATGGACQTPEIRPVRPLEQIRSNALLAVPPVEVGHFRSPDLVELSSVDLLLKLDIRYATSNNFLSAPVYDEPRAFLQRPAAEALSRVNRELRSLGYGLIIFDAYRPWFVTKIFWDATPPELHAYVSDPANGSRHNRGCAVDLTLFKLSTGDAVPMPSGFDEFSERASPNFGGGTADERANRDLLKEAMESEGFSVYPTEWWHFDYKGWEKYRILNKSFSELHAAQP